MKLISLDIEAADNGEILEISIFRFEQNDEIYHSYFKPIHTDSWTNVAHHITPEMVKNAPNFNNQKANIQDIINNSDGIIGFALQNDIRYLENHGVVIPATMYKSEIRDWFWYYDYPLNSLANHSRHKTFHRPLDKSVEFPYRLSLIFT